MQLRLAGGELLPKITHLLGQRDSFTPPQLIGRELLGAFHRVALLAKKQSCQVLAARKHPFLKLVKLLAKVDQPMTFFRKRPFTFTLVALS
jgi:hypothetical protein